MSETEEAMEVEKNLHETSTQNSTKESDPSDGSTDGSHTTDDEDQNANLSNSWKETRKSSLDRKLKKMEKRITASVTASIEKLIETALKPLKDDIKKLNESSQQQEKKLQEAVEITKENKELKRIVADIKSENTEPKQRLNKIENRMLENNFVIMGVQEDAWESESVLKDKLYQMIAYTVNAQDPNIQLENARKAKLVKVKRVGIYNKRKGRPISIQFENHSSVKYFWENKGYLPDGVFVKREYTEEMEKHRRILRPVYNAAKKHPDYKGKCRMEDNLLILKGYKYGLHNLKDLPADLSGHKVTSKTSKLVIGFFGELHPLSNFHRCIFQEGDITFTSSEQYIQYTKACYFETWN